MSDRETMSEMTSHTDRARTQLRGPGICGSALLILALLLAGLGCSVDDALRSAVETHPTTASAAEAVLATLEPGSIALLFEGQRLTIRSNRAPRIALIRRVAKAAGFELVVGHVEPSTLSVVIEKSALNEVLPILLGDLSYGVEYRFDPEQREHVVARLRVGEPETPVAAFVSAKFAQLDGSSPLSDSNPDSAERMSETSMRYRIDASIDASIPPSLPIDDPSLEDLRQHIEEIVLAQDALYENSESPDWSTRMDAIPDLPVTGDGLDAVLDALALDGDPEVRIAAAKRLGSGRSFAATAGLIDALNDPSTEVNLQAIESLVAIGDRSVLWDLQSILEETSNPEVQHALQQAIHTLDTSVGMGMDDDGSGGSGPGGSDLSAPGGSAVQAEGAAAPPL